MLDYLKPMPAEGKALKIEVKSGANSNIDVTRKFFIGGKQARPDGGNSFEVAGEWIGLGNRKDLRNAVEAMNASAWKKANAHTRAQVLYYLAENLERRKNEFRATLTLAMSEKDAEQEVERAIDCCFTFAALADKNGGNIASVPARAVALSLNEAVGNIGILANGALENPLRAVAAALCMGNAVTLIAPQSFPLSALDIASLCETSDVPAGAVNILAGSATELGSEMAKHAGIDAIWDFVGIPEQLTQGSTNAKQIVSGEKLSNDKAILRLATRVKTIWLPYGALN